MKINKCPVSAWCANRMPAGAPAVLAGAALALLLSACATAPVDQIKYFSQAFNSVNTLGQPLLDDLGVAERKQGQGVAETRARKVKRDGSAFAGDCPYPWFDASGNPGVIAGFCSK